MDNASDAAARAQMQRRGLMSAFSESRGYTDQAQKSETLG
jgi:hypothetical protein